MSPTCFSLVRLEKNEKKKGKVFKVILCPYVVNILQNGFEVGNARQ